MNKTLKRLKRAHKQALLDLPPPQPEIVEQYKEGVDLLWMAHFRKNPDVGDMKVLL